MPARRSTALVLTALTATVLLAGCSNSQSVAGKRPQTGSGTASPVAGIQQITIDAGPDLRFHPSTLVVHPGKVRIVLKNTAPSGDGPPHNLQVTGLPGAFVPLTPAGDVQAVTFTAPAPGTYGFVCTIHVEQGQTGKLIVKPG